MKFTALLHHLTVDLLRESFFSLKKKAAPGVDGLTWWEYETENSTENRLCLTNIEIINRCSGCNEIGNLAGINDRMLTEILKEINQSEITDLIGTGFTPERLAALVMVTRPASEIQTRDEAAHWLGMVAAKEICDRTEGKARQAVDLASEAPLDFNLQVSFVDSDGNGRPKPEDACPSCSGTGRNESGGEDCSCSAEVQLEFEFLPRLSSPGL